MSNNLINENSPYLLQHKNNPVNWLPWNSKTLKLIGSSSKPVLLSIGYSSCHWCHVMAHESFEDNDIAKYLNKNFISVKVDREERPDVDDLYQSSLSLMGQQGGWPLTMFLDKNMIPFWGGTYFPKMNKHGLPGFLDVLKHISKVFASSPKSINQNTTAIKKTLDNIYTNRSSDFDLADIQSIKKLIISKFDLKYGGLVGAPKFPMVPLLSGLLSSLNFLNKDDQDLFKQINNTVLSICLGGIYDHVGGGFSRYSTDDRWLVPHFEKMLYDNAQLIELISLLNILSPNAIYNFRIRKTLSWLENSLMFEDKDGCAFYTSVDADSEEGEGIYYVWDHKEIKELLTNSDNFSDNYNVSIGGNWEGKNILNRIGRGSQDDFYDETSKKNMECLGLLLEKRKKRTPPSIDNKILTDCNSMLICGLIRAHTSINSGRCLKIAIKIFNFIKKKHYLNGELYHNSCNGVVGQRATLADYANLIKACFLLNEATNDRSFLVFAKELLDISINNFFDKIKNDFYFTNHNKNDLFVKTKSVLDNATQSSTGLMLENLFRSSMVFGSKEQYDYFSSIIKNNWKPVLQNPIAHISFVRAAYAKLKSYQVCVFINKDELGDWIKNNLLKISPFCFVFIIDNNNETNRLSNVYKKSSVKNKTVVYVCSGFVCSLPITNVKDMIRWAKDIKILK